MATVIICDNCGKKLPAYALRVTPLYMGEESTFLNGKWNGGDYCTKECVAAVIARINAPAVTA